MLPLLPSSCVAEGRSSCWISPLICASLAGLAARTMMELLRGSGMSVVGKTPLPALACTAMLPLPGAAGMALPPASARRSTSGARSAATACLSGTTSTPVALEMSSAAMMRPMRCRLSL